MLCLLGSVRAELEIRCRCIVRYSWASTCSHVEGFMSTLTRDATMKPSNNLEIDFEPATGKECIKANLSVPDAL